MKNLISLALLVAIAAPAYGQSLAEAARREAERRSKLKDPVKVYTSADLESSPFLRRVQLAPPDAALKPLTNEIAQTPAQPAPAGAAATAEKAELPKVRDKRPEEHWRERAKVIRDRLDRLQADSNAVEGRVAELRIELESAPPSQTAVLTTELQQASQELTRLRGELRLIQDEWSKFEDRARAANIPAAWIR